MFYIDECVRSSQYGLGVVVQDGENPRVRFLGGGELLVEAHTLRLVPAVVYDAEVRNLLEIEQWLAWRVRGYADTQPVLLPRPRMDLAQSMLRAVQVGGLPRREEASAEVNYFVIEELNAEQAGAGC